MVAWTARRADARVRVARCRPSGDALRVRAATDTDGLRVRGDAGAAGAGGAGRPPGSRDREGRDVVRPCPADRRRPARGPRRDAAAAALAAQAAAAASTPARDPGDQPPLTPLCAAVGENRYGREVAALGAGDRRYFPDLDVLGVRGLRVEGVENASPRGGDDSDERHREEHPEDPGDLVAGRDGEEAEGWMQVHGAAVEEGRDEVALNDVEHDREERHDGDREGRPERDCDEKRNAGRDEAADVRNETAEERQNSQRQRERDAEDRHDRELRERAEG